MIGAPFIRVPPVSVTATLGAVARLECLAAGDPPPKVYWHSDRAGKLARYSALLAACCCTARFQGRTQLQDWRKRESHLRPGGEAGRGGLPVQGQEPVRHSGVRLRPTDGGSRGRDHGESGQQPRPAGGEGEGKPWWSCGQPCDNWACCSWSCSARPRGTRPPSSPGCGTASR